MFSAGKESPVSKVTMTAAFVAPLPLQANLPRPRKPAAPRRRFRAPGMSLVLPPQPPQQQPPSTPSFFEHASFDGPESEPLPIAGRQALLQALLSAGRANATLVVVFCRAKWCRSCATLAPKVARVAAQARSSLPSALAIHWYSMDVVDEPNRDFTSEVDVKMLPTFLFYRPVPKDQDSAGRKKSDAVENKCDTSTADDVELSLLRKQFIRSFIAGPFGARRLQDNLKEVLCRDSI